MGRGNPMDVEAGPLIEKSLSKCHYGVGKLVFLHDHQTGSSMKVAAKAPLGLLCGHLFGESKFSPFKGGFAFC